MVSTSVHPASSHCTSYAVRRTFFRLTNSSYSCSPATKFISWIVEHVTLFDTVCRFGSTQERCSFSNGSLASFRIINAARSPQAQFPCYVKFPIGTSYDKILIFKTAIEEHIKARPREWLSLNGFRANRIVVEQAFIEYVIVVQ